MLWKTEAGLLVPVRLPHRGALCRHVGPPLHGVIAGQHRQCVDRL